MIDSEGNYYDWDEESKRYVPRVGAKENTHYDIGGIETIEFIRAKLPPRQYEGYLLGNLLKYASRLCWKGSALADAKKALEYAGWLVEELEKDGPDS